MESRFELGEIVWAKIHSYPWWPGIVLINQISSITSDEETSYKIEFIGEDT